MLRNPWGRNVIDLKEELNRSAHIFGNKNTKPNQRPENQKKLWDYLWFDLSLMYALLLCLYKSTSKDSANMRKTQDTQRMQCNAGCKGVGVWVGVVDVGMTEADD